MMINHKFLFLAILLLLIFPVSAQNDEAESTYQSEGGAVQFSYSAEWTLEDRRFTFNTRYQFALLTPTYTPFQSPEERSQIFIELIN
jgi:hypothetical protein